MGLSMEMTQMAAKKEIQEGASQLPEAWNEEFSRRILALVDERDHYRELANRKTAEAEDNLVRAVLAERQNARIRSREGGTT